MDTKKHYIPEKVDKTRIISLEKGKLPPQAIDLEEAILGAMMIDRKGLDEAVDLLTPDVFYKDAHRHIFEVIRDLYNGSQPIDLLTVSAQLRKNLKLDLAGGDLYLMELSRRISSSAHIEFHCRLVLQKFIQREAIKAGSQIIEEAYDDDADALEILEKAFNSLGEVTNLLDVGKVSNFSADVKSYTDPKALSQGIASSLTDLNGKLSGYHPTDLIILAARPGMGKTALALNEILGCALRNEPVAFFSLEMSSQQIIGRLLGIMSGIETEKMRSRKFTPSEKLWVDRCALVLSKLPIFIDDTPALSTAAFRLKAKRVAREKKIKLIVVDYLQLMTVKGEKSFSRDNEIGKVSGSLKETAKRIDVPVIALSQLNRAVETRGSSKRPMLSDLRDSGNVEQDADVVLFLYRPEYYKIDTWDDEEQTPTKNTAEIDVAKFRNGTIGPVLVACELRYMRFLDISQRGTDITWKYMGEGITTPIERKPELESLPTPGYRDAFGAMEEADTDIPF